MPFEFRETGISGLLLVIPSIIRDERGFFAETYKESDFLARGIGGRFVQDNHSLSGKNVVRGLHYQLPPKSQGKLVRVVKGGAWDVAVDLRRSSPTFTRWYAAELSEENAMMLFIPPGFAHGFLALTAEVHLLYKCTEEYAPKLDAGIRWDDPAIGIDWPVRDPVISSKDRGLPYLKEAKIFG